jgi:hypothetical protein
MSPRPARRLAAHLRTYVLQGVLGLASCAHGGDEAREPAAPADPALALVKAKCIACHPLPEARSLTPAELPEWRVAHQKRVPLADGERALIERFLSSAPTP